MRGKQGSDVGVHKWFFPCIQLGNITSTREPDPKHHRWIGCSLEAPPTETFGFGELPEKFQSWHVLPLLLFIVLFQAAKEKLNGTFVRLKFYTRWPN